MSPSEAAALNAIELEEIRNEHRQFQEWLEASIAWMEHTISICADRRIPAADHLADGRAIVEISRKRLGDDLGAMLDTSTLSFGSQVTPADTLGTTGYHRCP